MSSSAPVTSSSRSRPQQRRKQPDDAAYIGASSSAVKRQAPDRADGEPRQKRKKLEPIFAVAASSSRRGEVSSEAKTENDKAASLSFATLPTEILYGYLSQHDLIPTIHPSPFTALDPPHPSSFEDPVQQSILPQFDTPANRPRRDPKEGRRRSLRLQEDEFATRTPILADLRELHAVLARLVEKHLTTQSNSVREVDTLAGFICSVDKRRGMDRLPLGGMYPSSRSSPPKPLSRISHPSTQSLQILPRIARPLPPNHQAKRSLEPSAPILRHSDSLRLVVSAFNESFYLHLRPNDHLVHPAARVKHYTTAPDGTSVLTRTEPLIRENIRAYMGEVVTAQATEARMSEDAAGALPRPKKVDELGWARIMIYDQGNDLQGRPPVFEGAFSVNGDIYHISRKEGYLRTKHPLDPEVVPPLDGGDTKLVVWRDSDTIHDQPAIPESCGHDRLSYNTDPTQNPFLQPSVDEPTSWFDSIPLVANFTKRQGGGDLAGPGDMGANFRDTIGQTGGCPNSPKVLYMGVAADCRYTAAHSSIEAATEKILDNWNRASALYKDTFNISLGIVEVQVQDTNCPSTPDPEKAWNVNCDGVNLNERLSLFSEWRGKKSEDGIGLWHLMSGCPTGNEVGIAWLATVCQMGSSGTSPSVVSGTGVSTSNRVEWQVIAHEIGHNFGAIHDCTDGCSMSDICCPLNTNSCNANGNFLMSPVASRDGDNVFSQCSIGNICSAMSPGSAGTHTDTNCLVDPDQARDQISLQMCGNGIVERGEDCDSGGRENNCCDAATCKFINNAVCDPDSSACCTGQCQFAPSSQVCRPSRDDRCDTTEMCTGNSSSCPTDVMQDNGHDCGDGLRCASGVCTSNDRQCQLVGAPLGLEKECPNRGDKSCLISCQDPQKPNQCRILQSPLIDGSPCGYGGMCVSGSCNSGNFIDTAKAWYTQNLQISIPVTIAGSIIVLLLLWAFVSACIRCTRGPPRGGYQVPLTPGGRMSQRGERLPSTYYTAPPGPPPPHPSRVSRGQAGWVNTSDYNGRNR